MKVDGYECDECGVERRQSNHWFLVEHTDQLIVRPWDWAYPDSILMRDCSHVKHICGHGCMQKLLEHWMSSKS